MVRLKHLTCLLGLLWLAVGLPLSQTAPQLAQLRDASDHDTGTGALALVPGDRALTGSRNKKRESSASPGSTRSLVGRGSVNRRATGVPSQDDNVSPVSPLSPANPVTSCTTTPCSRPFGWPKPNPEDTKTIGKPDNPMELPGRPIERPAPKPVKLGSKSETPDVFSAVLPKPVPAGYFPKQHDSDPEKAPDIWPGKSGLKRTNAVKGRPKTRPSRKSSNGRS